VTHEINKLIQMMTGSIRGGGAAQRVGGPTLAIECEKWILKHIANVNDIYGVWGKNFTC